MAAYSGPGNFTYWMSISSNGNAAAGATSENIPVVAANTYQFQVIASVQSTWASGVTLTLTFYSSSAVNLGSVSSTPASMTGGTLYQLNTGLFAAPAGSSYAVATITYNGTPGAANLLQVYQAEIDDQNYVQVNINYTFTYTTFPWTEFGGSTLAWNFNPLLAGDSDSLSLAGQIELMGGVGGVQCNIPELLDVNGQGPTFRILAPPSLNSAAYGYESSYDLNAPQPTQDVVASMLLDGERPFGYRASNRQISLPIVVFGTQAGGMAQVLRAREKLMQIIDQQVWQIKWTAADTGLPMLFDCFRALPSVPLYGFNYSAGGSATGSTIGKANYPIGMITLTIQAMPYGRSDVDGVQNLAFGTPLLNSPTSNGPATLDTFNTVLNPPPIINKPTWTALTSSNPTATASFNIAVGTTITAGSGTMVVEILTSANNITGVTDTKGNPYTLAGVKQVGGSALYGSIYTAPVVNSLSSSDHVTVTSAASQNFQAELLTVKGAWTATSAAVSNSGSASSYSNTLTGLTQYDMLLSFSFGAGSAGAVPANFTSVATPSGNGWNATISDYCMPINQTSLTYSIASGLPNPYSILVLPLVPMNQYWNYDGTTPPPGYVGHSAHYIPPRPLKTPYPSATFTQTLASSVSIVGCPVLSMQFGQSYDTQWPASPSFVSNVAVHWTLIDNQGRSIAFSTTYNKVRWGANPTAPKWTQFNIAIPQGKTFNYNAVTGYVVTISNYAGSGYEGYVRMHCWLNDLVATGQTQQNQVSPRGNLFNLFALPGSARSPISVQCQLPAAQNIVKEITTPATGSWIVPPGVYAVQGEAWGGGGAGSSTNLSRAIAGAGGGGAGYSQEPVLNVMPGQQVPWSLGSAGLPGQLVNTVIQFTTPGLGHWTCPAGVTSVLAETWGGGGAGAAGGGGGGGGGYGAKSVTVVPGTTYYLWCAKGGKADTGTSSAQNDSRVGQNSWFGPNGCQYAVNSYAAGSGGNTPLTGNSSGGHGATNTAMPGTTHYQGGRGGNAPGPSGGGGGGAAGSTGPGGVGGDALAYSSAGHWQTGGPGGTGTGLGGNGGAGANTPGFPGAGVVPGGGGGGGYQTSPLYNASNPSNTKPGTQTTNFLGGDGGNGMVQLTYAIGGGSPVNGTATTFGSTATTGTVVTANGGTSAANNSAAGAAGGTASGNTISFAGGTGGLVTSGAQASYISSPSVNTLLTFLNSTTFNSNTATTGVSAASVAQGVAIALIESTAQVADLQVTDSAGNIYQELGVQRAGSGANGVTLYAYVANIEYAITTSTTLTVTSGTSQQYGVLWYGSPWLVSGVTTGNSGTGNGTSSSFSSQFGVNDTQSVQLELGVVLSDGSTTVSSLTQTKTWYNASTTASLAAGTMSMAAYVMQNQGGGDDSGNATGDIFSGSLSGSANWAALSVPLVVANQQASIIKMDWRSGTSAPGAQTTWATEAAISANGYILVVGQCGTGASITSGPSAIADASGNTYTFDKVQALTSSDGAMFVATAPVTHALKAGTTGTYNWGTASAAPDWWISTYWVPNATGLDATNAHSTAGSSTAVTGSYTPASPNDMLVSLYTAANGATVTATAPGAPWNYIDRNTAGPLQSQLYAQQVTDETAASFSATLNSSSVWVWCGIAFTMNLAGTGGGAAGGPGGAGYPGIWQYGGPGYSGGSSGKGGSGGNSPANPGGGAGTPGGGGGGSLGSSAGAQEGGQGGQGMVRLTWSPPLQPFNTLIVHALGIGSNPDVNPCCPIPITDVPNNAEYAIPSVNGLRPAAFSSTYTVLLANYSWNPATSSSARQITVTINQYEYPGGPRYSVQVSRAVTPSNDITNGICSLGDVTLPVKDYAAFNDQSYFTVSINDTDTTDRFMDVLFLDSLGQTAIINVDPGNPGYGNYVNYFIDEATPDRDLGFVGASFQDRQHSVSVLDSAQIAGGPFYVGAGDNLFFVWSSSGAPNLAVQYAPRWYLDRSQ